MSEQQIPLLIGVGFVVSFRCCGGFGGCFRGSLGGLSQELFGIERQIVVILLPGIVAFLQPGLALGQALLHDGHGPGMGVLGSVDGMLGAPKCPAQIYLIIF